MQKIKAREAEYDAVFPGHHGAPAKKDALSQYIACAEGVISGAIQPEPGKNKQAAKYREIRIVLPKD